MGSRVLGELASDINRIQEFSLLAYPEFSCFSNGNHYDLYIDVIFESSFNKKNYALCKRG